MMSACTRARSVDPSRSEFFYHRRGCRFTWPLALEGFRDVCAREGMGAMGESPVSLGNRSLVHVSVYIVLCNFIIWVALHSHHHIKILSCTIAQDSFVLALCSHTYSLQLTPNLQQ